jgi:predicted amidophosphoribosyltransferase
MAGPDGIAAALPAILDLLPDDPGPGDRIVPVPPARDGGGVHLAGAIAHALARRGGRPIGAHDLRQIRRAHRQRSLSLPERQRNVADLFAIRRPLHPCHVLLVDDILTTGATLAAAARVLRAAGARRVDAFCFCRTVLDGAD